MATEGVANLLMFSAVYGEYTCTDARGYVVVRLLDFLHLYVAVDGFRLVRIAVCAGIRTSLQGGGLYRCNVAVSNFSRNKPDVS